MNVYKVVTSSGRKYSPKHYNEIFIVAGSCAVAEEIVWEFADNSFILECERCIERIVLVCKVFNSVTTKENANEDR